MRMDTIKRTCADFAFVVLTNKMWRIEHPRKLSFGVIDITTVESLKLVVAQLSWYSSVVLPQAFTSYIV